MLEDVYKVSVFRKIDKQSQGKQDHLAFTIQTRKDKAIYFYDYLGTSKKKKEHGRSPPPKLTRVIGEDLKVFLEMHRGFNNCHYYTVRDDGTSGDTIEEFKVWVDKDDNLRHVVRQIYAPQAGEILAFEMDPLNSNDVHSPDENFVEADSNW